MSEAISKVTMEEKIKRRINELPESKVDLGGYHTGKRDAYLNVMDDMQSGTFDLPTDVDVEEIEEAIQDFRDGRTANFSNKQFIKWLRQLLTKLSETNGWLQNANDAIETLNGELDYERNENESLRKAVAEKEVEVKQLNRQILDHYKTAKELFGGLSLDEFMAKYNETLAQVERLNAKVFVLTRDNNMLESTYSAQEEKLNQAVEALKRLSVPTPYENPHSELRYRQLFAKEALQSIKGGDTNVETTT